VGFLFLIFLFVHSLRVDDGVDRCESLTLTARFLVSSFFFFIFLYLCFGYHVLYLVCTKQICSLNVIVHGLLEV
jgi:hypothetical protein